MRKVLSNCMNCRKQNARPGEQIMDPLPSARVAPTDPPYNLPMWVWTTLAPLFLRQGRLQVKRYGCLFTCRTMRTVHMEVAHILEGDSFICAYQRFVSLRGKPTPPNKSSIVSSRIGHRSSENGNSDSKIS